MGMTKSATVTVKNLYRLEMEQEQAECLAALVFCNLCNVTTSPLDGLARRLQNALGLNDDQMQELAKRYSKFV